MRANEMLLVKANAQVGVSQANMYPALTLTAGTGFESLKASNWFNIPGSLFGLAGGTLIHRKRAADAALDQAGAMYKSAVLTAFQNVADSLHALNTDADALNAATRATSASQKSLDVVRHQLELGSVSYLALVNAEQVYQQAAVSLAQARANRYADTAALFLALGGSVAPLGTPR